MSSLYTTCIWRSLTEAEDEANTDIPHAAETNAVSSHRRNVNFLRLVPSKITRLSEKLQHASFFDADKSFRLFRWTL